MLSGVPTIIYGYFALLFVTPLLQKVFPACRASTCCRPAW
jgi:ABC-type phosphate transport system permease subunit